MPPSARRGLKKNVRSGKERGAEGPNLQPGHEMNLEMDPAGELLALPLLGGPGWDGSGGCHGALWVCWPYGSSKGWWRSCVCEF